MEQIKNILPGHSNKEPHHEPHHESTTHNTHDIHNSHQPSTTTGVSDVGPQSTGLTGEGSHFQSARDSTTAPLGGHNHHQGSNTHHGLEHSANNAAIGAKTGLGHGNTHTTQSAVPSGHDYGRDAAVRGIPERDLNKLDNAGLDANRTSHTSHTANKLDPTVNTGHSTSAHHDVPGIAPHHDTHRTGVEGTGSHHTGRDAAIGAGVGAGAAGLKESTHHNRPHEHGVGSSPLKESTSADYSNTTTSSSHHTPGTANETYLPGPAPNTAGPHHKDWLNKLDPRVNSKETRPVDSATEGLGHPKHDSGVAGTDIGSHAHNKDHVSHQTPLHEKPLGTDIGDKLHGTERNRGVAGASGFAGTDGFDSGVPSSHTGAHGLTGSHGTAGSHDITGAHGNTTHGVNTHDNAHPHAGPTPGGASALAAYDHHVHPERVEGSGLHHGHRGSVNTTLPSRTNAPAGGNLPPDTGFRGAGAGTATENKGIDNHFTSPIHGQAQHEAGLEAETAATRNMTMNY